MYTLPPFAAFYKHLAAWRIRLTLRNARCRVIWRKGTLYDRVEVWKMGKGVGTSPIVSTCQLISGLNDRWERSHRSQVVVNKALWSIEWSSMVVGVGSRLLQLKETKTKRQMENMNCFNLLFEYFWFSNYYNISSIWGYSICFNRLHWGSVSVAFWHCFVEYPNTDATFGWLMLEWKQWSGWTEKK